MQFQALIGGKVVSYPMTATFRVDQRKPGHKYEEAGKQSSISLALSKFHRVENSGMLARIVAIDGSKEIVLTKSEG